MNNLLESAITAHGGLDRWNQVKSITVDASITGAVWHVKNQGDALKNIRFEVDTTRQLLAIDFVGQDKRSVFEPHRVEIQHHDGGLIAARDDPEKSFEGHQFETPWDDLHLAYFVGEALWTYRPAAGSMRPVQAGWRRTTSVASERRVVGFQSRALIVTCTQNRWPASRVRSSYSESTASSIACVPRYH
jgi:hypothetical protein